MRNYLTSLFASGQELRGLAALPRSALKAIRNLYQRSRMLPLNITMPICSHVLKTIYWVTFPYRGIYKRLFGYDVFISYSRKDALEYSQRLESALRLTLHCYRDEGEALGGRPLSDIIKNGLLRSNAMIVIVTAEASKSPWVTAELDAFRAEREKASANGRKKHARPVFPIFIDPMCPGRLPNQIDWLQDHLGCKECDSQTPSRETVAKIKSAFPGVPGAVKLYVALTWVLIVTLAALSGLIFYRFSNARRVWLERAAHEVTSGRFDLAEWSVAKAAEGDLYSHWEDLERYSDFRARRMLVPDKVFALDNDVSVLALFNTTNGTCVLQLNTVTNALEFVNLSNHTKTNLMNAADHIPRFGIAGGTAFVAAGNQMVLERVDNALPPRFVRLPGNSRGVRAVGNGVRVLCKTGDGSNVLWATTVDRQGGVHSVELKGDLPPVEQMMLKESDDVFVCSIDSTGLRLVVRNWKPTGEEIPSLHWLFAGGSVDSPQLINGDRYVVFQSMRDYPGMDSRKEPELLAVDLIYPAETSGRRAVQRVSQGPATVSSLERSRVFAAAIGDGHQLRFWEMFEPAHVQQSSIPVTDGIQSFAVWTSPPATRYCPPDAAVVIAAKDNSIEIYAECRAVNASEPAIQRIARYPLQEGFEVGQTAISADGELVGVVQWKSENGSAVERLAIFQRAGTTDKPLSRVPHSRELLESLGLKEEELEPGDSR